MALPWRPRVVPRCTACLRNHSLLGLSEASSRIPLAPYQQVRGKKKMPKSLTLPVRLLQDVATYGRKGSLVPTTRGLMRSIWFSAGIASYISLPEMRQLRASKVAIERDFGFGTETLPRNRRAARRAAAEIEGNGEDGADPGEAMSSDAIASASAFQKDAAQRARISPERSMQLVEIFVPPRVEFYRQPILEDTSAAATAADALSELDQGLPASQSRRAGKGAAAELLAVRAAEAQKQKIATAAALAAKNAPPQAIYGSVSAHEVLVAIRAAMAENDEAARVVLQDGDVQFVDLPESEAVTEGEGERDRVKHVGDFTVEISIRGAEQAARRTVRVIAQNA